MEIPRHWRLKAQRYRLEGSSCAVCGQVTFPPRPVCPECTDRPARTSAIELPVLPLRDRIRVLVPPERMTV